MVQETCALGENFAKLSVKLQRYTSLLLLYCPVATPQKGQNL